MGHGEMRLVPTAWLTSEPSLLVQALSHLLSRRMKQYLSPETSCSQKQALTRCAEEAYANKEKYLEAKRVFSCPIFSPRPTRPCNADATSYEC